MKKREDELPTLQERVKEERKLYKEQHNGADPNPNDKRTNYSKALADYNDFKETCVDDNVKMDVLNKIISGRPVLAPPEQNPEIPTSSMDIEEEEEVRTVIGSSGLTREQIQRLQSLSTGVLLKEKEQIKQEMDDTQSQAQKYDILKKIPESQQTGEIKKEISEAEIDALGMKKLQAVYDSYKNELEKRGVMEVSTQTDTIPSALEQAKYLSRKYPTLADIIMNIFIKNVVEKGNVEDIKKIADLIPKESPFYHKDYLYQEILKSDAMKTSLKYNVVPLSFINQKYKYWD